MAFAVRKMISINVIYLLAVVITADSCVCMAFAQIYTNRTLHSAAPHVVLSPQSQPAINNTTPHLKGPSTVIASPVTDEFEGNATSTNTTTAGTRGTFSGTR
jgi:hypothetical protein